jgi:hypothetical protein
MLDRKIVLSYTCGFALEMSEVGRRRLKQSMKTNLTNRKHATLVATTANWQPSVGMRGAGLSVYCTGSLPTNFIGGGLAQRQAQSIESLRLSDCRYSQI